MTWLIGDANIFIDMEVGGILEPMFHVPETIAVPDVLFAEELQARHAYLLSMGLMQLEVQERYVREAFRLGDIYRKPSHNDLLALSLAKQEACPLLTGDKRLREAALAEQLEVRGTLWLVRRLFLSGALEYCQAVTAYERMKKNGRRLPWDDVGAQLYKMSKESSPE